MSAYKVDIIIPCYFASEKLVDLTRACVESIKQYTDTGYRITLVDDGSPLPFESAVDIVRLPENKGYAAAVNFGVFKTHGDVIVILNNDTEVSHAWLGPLTYSLTTGDKRQYDIMSLRTTDADGYGVEDKITDNDKFGSVWAIRRTTWTELGGLDESFGKGYFEDLDLYRRARQKGMKIGKNHAVSILHHGKQTFSEVDPDDTAYIAAHERYFEKHGVDVTPSVDSW